MTHHLFFKTQPHKNRFSYWFYLLPYRTSLTFGTVKKSSVRKKVNARTWEFLFLSFLFLSLLVCLFRKYSNFLFAILVCILVLSSLNKLIITSSKYWVNGCFQKLRGRVFMQWTHGFDNIFFFIYTGSSLPLIPPLVYSINLKEK